MKRKTDIEWVVELIEKIIVWGAVLLVIGTIVYMAIAA